MTPRLGRLIASCGMSQGREPRKHWDTGRLALYGAFLGFGVGVIHAYVMAFGMELTTSSCSSTI